MVIPLWKYKLMPTMCHADQKSILDYVSTVNKTQYEIKQLEKENKSLKDMINTLKCVDTEETFLQKLVSLRKLKSEKSKICYDDEIKSIALYYFLLGGRFFYKNLCKNFPLPSISTVLRHLYERHAPKEGEICVLEYSAFNMANCETKYVWVCEDDTRLVEGLTYNPDCDIVVGFVLPLDEMTGTPRIDYFKFSSVLAVKDYLKKHQLSSYAKLITICSLEPNVKPYILSLYGTKGSDLSEDVEKRWLHITRELKKEGIIVMGENIF